MRGNSEIDPGKLTLPYAQHGAKQQRELHEFHLQSKLVTVDTIQLLKASLNASERASKIHSFNGWVWPRQNASSTFDAGSMPWACTWEREIRVVSMQWEF